MDFETYGLTMEDIGKLTVRQVYFLYLAERTKEGARKPMPYFYITKEQKFAERVAQFKQFGKSLGKTDEEIEKIIEEAVKNGTI